jgi:putative ABC transport system ATP-binding protein
VCENKNIIICNLLEVLFLSAILRTSEISKTFLNNQTVVKPTSIEIKKGKIYVIEGKSGSGKSTLLSMLGGLEQPTQGKVYFNNRSFYELSDQEQAQIRGCSFGFVFQSFNLLPELSVKENIELPLIFNENTQQKLNVKELAERLYIDSLLHKKTSLLSGGEQQRVAIARALITLPDIVFADEPTGNLDHYSTKVIVKLLTELNAKYGISLVIVTHEKNLIDTPHTLFTMKNGELRMENENA